jgi:hypothetical protein
MDLIRDILKHLNSQEVKRLKAQIKNNPHEFEKVGFLFDLILKYPEKPEDFFAHKLYGKAADNSFRVTKARLKRMMEDLLIGEKSLKEYDADYIIAHLTVKKRLLQGEILMGRGAYPASKNILEQVITMARKYHFIDEWFQAQMLMFRHNCSSLNATDLMREVDDLKNLSLKAASLHEAGVLYYQLSAHLATTTLKKASEFKDARKIMERLKAIWDFTHAPMAGFYFLKIAIYYTQITSEFKDARAYGQQLLELVRTEPALKSKQREGAALLQMSEICLRSGELSRAHTFSKATLNLYNKDEINYLISLETAWRIAFMQNDLELANQLIAAADAHPGIHLSKMRAGRWKYYHAVMAFKMKAFKKCILLLNEATSVMSDKLGWNIAFRLLEIMALFESQQTDVIDAKIENFRQFVKRNKHDDEYARAALLTDLLHVWHKNQYDFKTAEEFIKDGILKIKAYHSKVPFNPASFELIRFDNWIEAHA